MTLFEEPSIKGIVEGDEGQLLDFKSARIHPRDLADILIAFANADGGVVVIGVEKDRQITGTRRHADNVQNLVRAAFDYCEPAVKVETRYLDGYDERGEPDQVLLMQVARSSIVHNNTRKTVYLRVGDQNRRLGVQEVLQLAYDKGQANYESELARGATYGDLDTDLVKRYAQVIEARGDLPDLLIARELAQWDGDELDINLAGVLLFGHKPDHWHPRPGIRFLRYEGTEALTGADMNIVKDRTIEQPLPRLLDETFALVGTLIRDFSHFSPGGKFTVTPEYPEFVWQEGITNAVAHRAYNITGRPVEVLMFDDRLEIISPGRFPGTVRAETIRQDHFSRNPRIARVLAELRYIKDIGEGVDRMVHEMEASGLPPPEWIEEPAAVRVILRNGIEQRRLATPEEVRAHTIVALNDRQRRAIEYLQERGRITNREYRELCDVSDFTARADLNDLVQRGLVISEGRGRSRRYRLAGD